MIYKSYHLHHFKFLIINTNFLFNIILLSTLTSKYKTKNLIKILLKPTKKIKNYQKYKHLKNNNKSFYNYYKITLTKIQTKIIKQHQKLKKNPNNNNNQLIKNTKLLLNH